MITIIVIILLVITIGLIGIWFSYKYYTKKKYQSEKERQPPQDILNIFNTLEHEMKGGIKKDGTTENPYTISWKEARRRSKNERDNENERESSIGECNIEIDGQQHIQSGTNDSIMANSTRTEENKPIARNNSGKDKLDSRRRKRFSRLIRRSRREGDKN